VVGAVLLVPGLLSIVYAVLVLAHGGAAWGMPAYACMVCAVALACLRLWRDLRSQSITLSWDPAHGAFHSLELARPYELKRVWRAWGWVTLAVASPCAPGRILYLVVWKSSVSPPLWSELALRLEAGASRLDRH